MLHNKMYKKASEMHMQSCCLANLNVLLEFFTVMLKAEKESLCKEFEIVDLGGIHFPLDLKKFAQTIWNGRVEAYVNSARIRKEVSQANR